MKIFEACPAAMIAICCISNAWCQQKSDALLVRQFKDAVACVVDAQGAKRPVLRKSSGYRELDRAALDAGRTWCKAPTRIKVPDAIEQKPARAVWAEP